MRPLWISGLVLGILLPRIYLIVKFQSALIESDEAIVGLMGRHILRGELPIFYYGQNYMGAIEPFLTAAFFAIFGATVLVLKLVPFVLLCAFVVVHYFLACAVVTRQTAILATALVAVSPAFLNIWSLKSRGGYMALLVLGTLALLVAARMLNEGYTHRKAALLGLSLGLAWWTHFLSIVYIVPILVVLLLKNERKLLSSTGMIFLGSFFFGSLPFWMYNLSHSWASLRMEGGQQTEFLSDFLNFSGTAVPIFLGARRNWGGADFFPLAGFLILGILLGCVATLLWKWFRNIGPASLEGKHLLGLFFFFFPLLFSASGFAWFFREPRYLIPLYSVVYILILAAVSKRALQVGLCLFLLALNVTGSLLTKIEDFTGYTNVESNEELLDYLRRHNVSRAYAPYWVAYRLTFESGEEIICTPSQEDVVRYPPYLELVKSAPTVAYIRLNAPRYEGLHAEIKPPDGFRAERVGNYEVFLPPKSN